MSSLVTSASLWTNDDNMPKKRQPTMRKTIKLRPDSQSVGEVEYEDESESLKKMQPSSIDDHKDSLEKRNERVNELLSKMTSPDATINDNKMGNFSPIDPPSLNVKKNTNETNNETMPSYLHALNENKKSVQYSANNNSSNNLSNYQRIYEPPVDLVSKPYYANMGIGPVVNGATDNKLMEKINYMIRMLEEQNHEKTNNITEEFILYTFLGVFIIFVVDSFSRSGKYTR